MACSAVAAPASATATKGVAMPSLSPLSTLISLRIRSGTSGLRIMPAPRAASVGARAAPTSSASQMSVLGSSTNASRVPRPMVSGRPTASSRAYRVQSARNLRRSTRDASANSTRTRVASARTRTVSGPGAMPSTASGPWVSSRPAPMKMIGAVTSARSSRADSAPHANIRAPISAMSDAVTCPPHLHQQTSGRAVPGSAGRLRLGGQPDVFLAVEQAVQPGREDTADQRGHDEQPDLGQG